MNPAELIRTRRLQLAALAPAEHSIAAIARRLGVSPDSLRAWETGASRPRRRSAVRLARLLGLDAARLVEGESPDPD